MCTVNSTHIKKFSRCFAPTEVSQIGKQHHYYNKQIEESKHKFAG
jgi:hypothetical protein